MRLYRVSKALERQAEGIAKGISERIAKGRIFEGITAGRRICIKTIVVHSSESHAVVSFYATEGQRSSFFYTDNTYFWFAILLFHCSDSFINSTSDSFRNHFSFNNRFLVTNDINAFFKVFFRLHLTSAEVIDISVIRCSCQLFYQRGLSVNSNRQPYAH